MAFFPRILNSGEKKSYKELDKTRANNLGTLNSSSSQLASENQQVDHHHHPSLSETKQKIYLSTPWPCQLSQAELEPTLA